MRSRWELITPYYAHPEAAQATSCKMESLLSIYRSDGESEEEGVAARQEQQQQQRDSDDDSDDAAAGGGSSRTGTKKRPTAVDSAGSRKRRLVGTGTLPSPAAASAAASGLPGLDADFFSVSPNHGELLALLCFALRVETRN